MDRKVITDEEFESLWQQAAAVEHSRPLVEGYAGWHRRRRLATAGVALCMIGAVLIAPLWSNSSQGFDHVYSNNSSMPDSHWIEVAAEMLVLEMV